MPTDNLDPTTLRALAKRVEAGESGDFLNVELCDALAGRCDVSAAPDRIGWRWPDGETTGRVPLTTSLDAIEALRVRLLPGSTIEIQSGSAEDSDARWFSCTLTDHRPGGGTLWPTRCIDERNARLAALLYAVAAKVEGEGRV